LHDYLIYSLALYYRIRYVISIVIFSGGFHDIDDNGHEFGQHFNIEADKQRCDDKNPFWAN